MMSGGRRYRVRVFAGLSVLSLLLITAALLAGGRFDASTVQALAQPQTTRTWGPVSAQTPLPVVTLAPSIAVPTLGGQDAIDQTILEVSPAAPVASVPEVAGSADDSLLAYDGTRRRVAVPILMYHYISTPPEDADVYRQDLSVTPEQFRAQMQYLADHGYSVVSLYDVNDALRWGKPLPPQPVVLTFDDGYADAYHNAFPILREFGYTATFFVITQRLDENHPDYLTWDQAREMADARMSIESHTKDHPDMRQRNFDFLYYEIVGSIESIEAHTGHRARLFCYPAGRWDLTVMNILPSFGVVAAVTTEGGIEHRTDAMYLMRRVRISGDTAFDEFAALLEWAWDRATS